MDRPLPSRDSPRWWLWLSVVLVAGVIGVFATREEKVEIVPTVASKLPRKAEAAGPVEAVADYSAALPPVIPAGHEGHGEECASCAAERGLATCREDYAQMEYARLREDLDADEGQSRLLLENCRRFAAAVVKEWSHARSRPVLPPDEVVAGLRQQILDPSLSGIPQKTE